MAGIKSRQIDDDERRRRAITIGELEAEGIDIFCWCNRCGHNATLAIEQLARELGPTYAVPEVGARTRCTGCGSKDVATRPAWPSLGQVAHH